MIAERIVILLQRYISVSSEGGEKDVRQTFFRAVTLTRILIPFFHYATQYLISSRDSLLDADNLYQISLSRVTRDRHPYRRYRQRLSKIPSSHNNNRRGDPTIESNDERLHRSWPDYVYVHNMRDGNTPTGYSPAAKPSASLLENVFHIVSPLSEGLGHTYMGRRL